MPCIATVLPIVIDCACSRCPYVSIPATLCIHRFHLALSAPIFPPPLQAALRHYQEVPLFVLIALGVATCIPPVLLARLERVDIALLYECPLVPYLPLMGVFCNIYLICSLNIWSYVRMLVWTAVGMTIYFFYGMQHSMLNPEAERMKVNGGESSP